MYRDVAVQTESMSERGELDQQPFLTRAALPDDETQTRPVSQPSNLDKLSLSVDSGQSGQNDTLFIPPLEARSRYAGLTYHRPSESRRVETRVLSLPLDPPPALAIPGAARVVSLPMRGRFGDPDVKIAEFIEDSSNSFETVYISDGYDDSGRSVHYYRAPRTDLPRTPSPPSSTDSVIIVSRNHGDEDLLVGCAYNRPRGTLNKPLCITAEYHLGPVLLPWTSSPPRPIPALHGPSSLPYARCPS